ncbi:hypothetical protein UABHE_006754 [Candidatus Uabimicrobium helgolandensis]
MRLLFALLFGLFTSTSIFCQDIEYYAPEDTDNAIFQQTYENDESVFKFAWERAHYGYEYSIARQGGWIDPSSAGNLVIAGFITRNEDDGDSRAISGYASFRPFLLDYGTYSFAIGVSYFGTLQKFYEPTNVADNEDIGGNLADITTRDIDVDLNYQAFSLSVLGSFPEAGLQVVFEIGYLLSNLRSDIGNINVVDDATQGAILTLNESQHHFNQRDHSLYMSLEIRKLFERNYFSLFSLYFYANINLNSERQKSAANVDVNIGGIPDDLGRVEDLINGAESVVFGNLGNIDPEDQTLDVTYIGTFLTSRLVNIPFGYESIGEQSGLALEMINGIEYGYGEFFGTDVHGAALQSGVQITFLELMTLSYTHTWHQSNDFEDEWNVTLSIGLYGAITPSASQRVSAGVGGGR